MTSISSNGTHGDVTRLPVLRVGVIGAAAQIAQAVHLPTLLLLSHLYEVVALCDISPAGLAYCAAKFRIPRCYESVEELCADPVVDVVFVLTADEYHEEHTVTALKHDKHVLVEKPVAMSIPALRRMIEAEKQSRGRVFVAYMRRYANALDTFKDELASVKANIKFARVRDIVGPNAGFISQSGTFPQTFTDYPATMTAERTALGDRLRHEVFPDHAEVKPMMATFSRFLGGLGSHDLSVMREALGMPHSCTGVSMHPPFFTATFEYDGFALHYETGLDSVPRFDAHLQVYADKTIKLQYDSSYIKGLPTRVIVDEKTAAGSYQQREIVTTYEDAYTAELMDFHTCLARGKAIKTSLTDALQDLDIFLMVLRRAFPGDSNP